MSPRQHSRDLVHLFVIAVHRGQYLHGTLATPSERERRAAAHATADPVVRGRTSRGIPCQLADADCSIVSGLLASRSSVRRLLWQPKAKTEHGRSRRSCQRPPTLHL